MKFKVLFAATAIAASMSAQAVGTVKLTDYTHEPRAGATGPYSDTATNAIVTVLVDGSAPVPPPAGSWSGGGQLSGLLNGTTSFVAYCVEIDVGVAFGPVYNDYAPVSGALGFGARAANLASLISWASAAGMPSNAAQSAALQAAVWEVVHETTIGAYSFATGKLKTTSLNPATQTALNNIQTNWAAIMATAPTYTVSRLDSLTKQDFLIFAPVPEVGTLAMMALGLAGVGFAARKRRQS